MKIWKIDGGEFDYVFAESSEDALQVLREEGHTPDDDVLVTEVGEEEASKFMVFDVDDRDSREPLLDIFRRDPRRQWVASTCW